MDKTDYIHKMESTIQEMEIENITPNPLDKLIAKIKHLLQSKYQPDDKKSTLLNHAPNIPRIFGEFKDHKTSPKMRPIVNKSEGPTYDAEKYMKNIYNKILHPSNHSLSSTLEFIQRLCIFSRIKNMFQLVLMSSAYSHALIFRKFKLTLIQASKVLIIEKLIQL